MIDARKSIEMAVATEVTALSKMQDPMTLMIGIMHERH
ncbi:hypothetical protein ALP81_200181 [Pseudomonas savastanoi pv. fraxini]|nr:hypothetical protein ALP81_200181 [Pseudomonas savastanoi pv. fraxini]